MKPAKTTLEKVMERIVAYITEHSHEAEREAALVAIVRAMEHGSSEELAHAWADLGMHCMAKRDAELWRMAGLYLIEGKSFSPKWRSETACSIMNYAGNTPITQWTRAGLRASVANEGNTISRAKLDEILSDMGLSDMFRAGKRGRKTAAKPKKRA